MVLVFTSSFPACLVIAGPLEQGTRRGIW